MTDRNSKSSSPWYSYSLLRDGGLKREKVKDTFKEEQQKLYSKMIVGNHEDRSRSWAPTSSWLKPPDLNHDPGISWSCCCRRLHCCIHCCLQGSLACSGSRTPASSEMPKLLGLSSEGALLGNAARDKMPSFFYNKPVGGMPLKLAPPVHVQAGGWEATATFPR